MELNVKEIEKDINLKFPLDPTAEDVLL